MEKIIRWNPEKAKILREDPSRNGISFEECVVAIESGDILDIISNPSSNFPNQKIFILNIDGYIYDVPFVETEDEIFLKTLFPNRKHQKKYLPNK